MLIMKTCISTDWIEVHDFESSYFAKVFVTQNEAYMIVKAQNQTKFFRVDRELLALGEIGFFQKAMESAEELSLEMAFEMGLIEKHDKQFDYFKLKS